MTDEVELIGDYDEVGASLSALKSEIEATWLRISKLYKSLPISKFKSKVNVVLKNIYATIKESPGDLNNLNINLNKLKRINRYLEVKLSDIGYYSNSKGMNVATGLEDKLILGVKPDKRPRSVEMVPQPVPKPMLDSASSDYAYGVGSGMGDDFEEIGYYAETQMGYLGYNDTDFMHAVTTGQTPQKDIENPQYQTPNKPGASPYEVRIREGGSPAPSELNQRVNEYSPSAKVRTRDKSASQIRKRKRALQKLGRKVDARAIRHSNKVTGVTPSQVAKENRELSRITDIDERFFERPVETKRGGGHTIIQELGYDDDDYDEEIFYM